MTEELNTAFNLLGIGMITVIVVLSLVVGMGNLMIRLVNLIPEPVSPQSKSPKTTPSAIIIDKQIAAITAAVAAVSHGGATITKIEKKK